MLLSTVRTAPKILLGITAAVLFGSACLLDGCGGTGPDDDREIGDNRNWAGLYLRSRLNPYQEPQLGEYSSRSEAVIRQHVEWAQQADMDFFAVSWRGDNTYGHTTLVNYILPDTTFGKIRWCILYETPTVLAGNPDAATINLTMDARETLLRHLLDFNRDFFSLSNYLRIDGKPVIILRRSRLITGDPWIALNAVRHAYSDSTLGETYYLIGDEAIWGSVSIPNNDRLRAMDAITGIDIGVLTQHNGYPQSTGFISDLSTMWQTYASAAQGLESPIPLVPMVWPGFNDRASSQVQHPVIAREMTSGTTQSGSAYEQVWTVANTMVGEPAVVLLNSFNSWQTDTQVEPIADNGNELGTTTPTTLTEGIRYFPYLESFVDDTARYKGNVLLGAIYEVWYDDEPPSGF